MPTTLLLVEEGFCAFQGDNFNIIIRMGKGQFSKRRDAGRVKTTGVHKNESIISRGKCLFF